MTKTGKHAIVLGASMAGLLTARVLSDHFEHVTLVERDRLPDSRDTRKGVPQARHAHGVLARGLNIMEQLFPGLKRDLVAGGAEPGDLAENCVWYQFGGYKSRANVGLEGVVMSRPFLESLVRRRVLKIPNLTTLQETDVLHPITDESKARVTGVTVQQTGHDPQQLLADLTVDTTGRGTQAPRWLESLGYGRPDESVVKINLAYVSRYYRRPKNSELDAIVYIIASTPPQGTRMATLFAVEDDRWICTLIGFLGDHPPMDEAGYLEFARSLPTPDIYNHIHKAEPLTELVAHKFPADLRRHYEKMRRFPEGYVVLGDAMCSFNPYYGQGMSVAAMETMTLADCLKAQPNGDLTGLPMRFFKQATPVVDIPWTIAAGEDLRYRQVEGPRPPGFDLLNSYVVKVHQAATTDPEVCRAFFNVANLNAPPASLMKPSILLRVMKATMGAKRASAPVRPLETMKA